MGFVVCVDARLAFGVGKKHAKYIFVFPQSALPPSKEATTAHACLDLGVRLDPVYCEEPEIKTIRRPVSADWSIK